MISINAKDLSYKDLNRKIQDSSGEIEHTDVIGQRFIGAGLSDKKITINGIPGNALGAYLNGAEITVNGNAQDAVGDTMNEGCITVHGNIGDAAGYAMRGGRIFVKGDAGYRAGIHMKAYKEKSPVLVIGGKAGSFLGEYQAGGSIIVLGIGIGDSPIVSNFPCTGMHGGKMFLRSSCDNIHFPHQVSASSASADDIAMIREHVEKFCSLFGYNSEEILGCPFTVVTPDSKNPYKQMYVDN